MIKNKVKKESGFAASDALIAILIIALFSGLIATIAYNIYLSNTSIKRIGVATQYITNIFESVDKLYYEDINVNGLENYINQNQTVFNTTNNQVVISSNDLNETSKTVGNTSKPSYTIDIYVEYYNKTEGNTDKLDLVKQITVTVRYKLGNRNQEIKMTRLKPRESLVTPNKPDMSLLNVTSSMNVYPIKRTDGTWRVCDVNDIAWYSYESGYWAGVIATTEKLELNDEALAGTGNIYIWIPRYAYDASNNSVLFLYRNTNNFVGIDETNNYNILTSISGLNTYNVPEDFRPNGENNTGVWEYLGNYMSTTFSNLNSVYPIQK